MARELNLKKGSSMVDKINPYVFFWRGETADALRAAGPVTMLVACFLNTAYTNHIGLFCLDVDRAASDTGLTSEQVQAELQTLEQTGFLKYDEQTQMVWIIDRADFALGRIRANDKARIKLANAEFAAIPLECTMREEFFEQYEYKLRLSDLDEEVEEVATAES
ncbi:hypothetical protein GTP44_15435 [Duganella sp. FT50W]|uniref:Uncharacterized protein n=1 Tax=Duganella lactea TaxID=2692173 RepID=A0A6L8MM64_9BURK|nr:hypothetical protein [Duganella lactea]MYM83341.1 hypothetical protein [Duganella lactea]